MFTDSICHSEAPEPTTARGMTKNMWKPIVGSSYDNDYLDTLTGCMVLGSYAGARLVTSDKDLVSGSQARRRMSELWREKRGGR